MQKLDREAMIEEIRRVMVSARLDWCLPYNEHHKRDEFVAARLFEFFERHIDPATASDRLMTCSFFEELPDGSKRYFKSMREAREAWERERA